MLIWISKTFRRNTLSQSLNHISFEINFIDTTIQVKNKAAMDGTASVSISDDIQLVKLVLPNHRADEIQEKIAKEPKGRIQVPTHYIWCGNNDNNPWWFLAEEVEVEVATNISQEQRTPHLKWQCLARRVTFDDERIFCCLAKLADDESAVTIASSLNRQWWR